LTPPRLVTGGRYRTTPDEGSWPANSHDRPQPPADLARPSLKTDAASCSPGGLRPSALAAQRRLGELTDKRYPQSMLLRGRPFLLASLAAATVPLAACASAVPRAPAHIQAGSGIDRGSVVIRNTGTYDYVLMTGCQSFKFSRDGGTGAWLDARGAVQLAPGLWTGSCYRETLDVPSTSPLPCLGQTPPNCTYSPATYSQRVSGTWSLTLTSIGSSY
jgi:hypothetical protein